MGATSSSTSLQQQQTHTHGTNQPKINKLIPFSNKHIITSSTCTTTKRSLSSPSPSLSLSSTPRDDDSKYDIIPTIPRCRRILSCGHICAGVQNETINECFCLEEACVTKQLRIRQHASDHCAICLTSLSDDTCLALPTCGHVFHASCIRDMLISSSPHTWIQPQIASQHIPQVSRITFTHAMCVYCRNPTQLISHSTLNDIMQPICGLHTMVSSIIQQHINMDALAQDERIIDINSNWYNRVNALAWHIYAIYQCHRCNLPYFGGQIACEDGMNIDDRRITRSCPSCTMEDRVLSGVGCKDMSHESDWLYKCRFCCSEALWTCYGGIHCCDYCHSHDFDAHTRGVADRQAERARCPPEGKHECPLGLKEQHKNGTDVSCEMVIRCIACTFTNGNNISQSSGTILHSSNLLGETPSLMDWQPLDTSISPALGTRIRSMTRKQTHTALQRINCEWKIQSCGDARLIKESHMDGWEMKEEKEEEEKQIVVPIEQPVAEQAQLIQQPAPERYGERRDCLHLCDMWSGQCCACTDPRPFTRLTGMVIVHDMEIPRYIHYCPPCHSRELARWQATARAAKIDLPVQLSTGQTQEVDEMEKKDTSTSTTYIPKLFINTDIEPIDCHATLASTSTWLSELSSTLIHSQASTRTSTPAAHVAGVDDDEHVHKTDTAVSNTTSVNSPNISSTITSSAPTATVSNAEDPDSTGFAEANISLHSISHSLSRRYPQPVDELMSLVGHDSNNAQQRLTFVTSHFLPTVYSPQRLRPRMGTFPGIKTQKPAAPMRSASHFHLRLHETSAQALLPPTPANHDAPLPPPRPVMAWIPVADPAPAVEFEPPAPASSHHIRIRSYLPPASTCYHTTSGLAARIISLARCGAAFGLTPIEHTTRMQRVARWFHSSKPGVRVPKSMLQQWIDEDRNRTTPVIDVSEYVRVMGVDAEHTMHYLLRVELLNKKKRVIWTRETRQTFLASDEWDRIRLVLMWFPVGVRYIRVTHGVDSSTVAPVGDHLEMAGLSVKLHTASSS